jgi:multicomponent Na+:H+ antiporter subunit G
MGALLVDLLSWILLLAGGFFLIVGAIGLNRMPDVFSRLHATGVSDTLGAGFLFLGMMLQAGLTLVAVKLLFLLLIFFFTTPVATHAVTRAALSVGVEPLLIDRAGQVRETVAQEVRKAKTEARPPSTGEASPSAPRTGGKGGRPSKR